MRYRSHSKKPLFSLMVNLRKITWSIPTALPFFLPFLGFIAKSRYFFILEPFSVPNLFLCFFLIFYFILIPIPSSFWFPPLIWWVDRLAELWGGKMAAYVAILIDRFIASGGPFPHHLVGAAVARCEVAGG
jgi:hypothetical protein